MSVGVEECSVRRLRTDSICISLAVLLLELELVYDTLQAHTVANPGLESWDAGVMSIRWLAAMHVL
jgi:hypothetical protein